MLPSNGVFTTDGASLFGKLMCLTQVVHCSWDVLGPPILKLSLPAPQHRGLLKLDGQLQRRRPSPNPEDQTFPKLPIRKLRRGLPEKLGVERWQGSPGRDQVCPADQVLHDEDDVGEDDVDDVHQGVRVPTTTTTSTHKLRNKSQSAVNFKPSFQSKRNFCWNFLQNPSNEGFFKGFFSIQFQGNIFCCRSFSFAANQMFWTKMLCVSVPPRKPPFAFPLTSW